jgi:hypothetical protein
MAADCYNSTIYLNLDSVLSQLRQERDRLNQAITALESINSNGSSRHGISAAGRERIAAAQCARWARVKGKRNVVSISKRAASPKRTMSPAARRRIVAAQKARWAKWRKQTKAA